MKFKTILRHFRESFKSIGRNGWMTFASISAVAVTLSIVGVFVVILMNINHFANNIQNDVEIRVHIDQTATAEEQTALREKIENTKYVKTVRLSTKEQELKNMIKNMGDNGEVFKLFEQDNPLNDVFVVKTNQPENVTKVAESVESMPSVQEIEYGKDYVEKLFGVVKVGRNIGMILIAGLLFTAMFLISNTIKITIFARKREIEIMRLVGATNSFIRWPFFLEGLWLGVFGAVIPILLIGFAYQYIIEFMKTKVSVSIQFFELLPMQPFIFQVAGILVLFGALIGVWGSMISVRKFLKV